MCGFACDSRRHLLIAVLEIENLSSSMYDGKFPNSSIIMKNNFLEVVGKNNGHITIKHYLNNKYNLSEIE